MEIENSENEQKLDIRPGLIVSIISIITMLAFSAWAWMQIPAGQPIPVHWGLDGEPDRYGSKIEALLTCPAIVIFETLLFSLIPRIEPRKLNLARSGKVYIIIWIISLLPLVGIHLFLVLTALGRQLNVITVVSVTLGITFIVIGNYLGKIRSNFFMGIRTPWTLSSELSWYKTHRLGGWMFVILGICLLAVALLNLSAFAAFIIIIVGTLAITAVLMVYSYFVWRYDQTRQSMG